jgi:Domain of unknown function (DUF4265)
VAATVVAVGRELRGWNTWRGMSAGEFVVHQDPVWRDRANFIVNAELRESDRPRRFEQLWTRQLGDDEFEICCIPFFLYDIALGDTVGTAPRGNRRYVVDAVRRPSGRYVFRAWFGGVGDPPREAVVAELTELGALVEWSSRTLLAIDAADASMATRVADALAARESAGELRYETGRTA